MNDTSIQEVIANVPVPHDTSGRHAGWLTELIRRRAYEIYEGRCDSPGTAEEDWLQAERELKYHFGL